METLEIIFVIIALAIGLALGYAITFRLLSGKGRNILREAEEKAEVTKKEKMLQAKERFLQLKVEHEKEVSDRNAIVQKNENRIKQRESQISQKLEELQRKEHDMQVHKEKLANQTDVYTRRLAELEHLKGEEIQKLEGIANLSAVEAKEQLVCALRDEAKSEALNQIREVVEEAKLTANKEAKKIVIETIQRTATEHAIENTVSVFNLDNEEVKGRIIGREGRNIRTLESLTGVEILIDDSPDAIILSSFDPVRREVARLSLHKLVTDGRIHPARIEEVVLKTQKQIEQEIMETGKRACIDLGIHNLHTDLVRMVGRMKYRSSYGQNLLQHSLETANLCATMAAELGLNAKLARRAGLLHDIGKVSETEPELPHALLGMKLAERCKERPEICNAIGSHHDECEMDNLFSPIVQVCDAISGARPGARREVVDAYINRLKKLEELALTYPGVLKTFAIQAGRELRVIVESEKISDADASQISFDLSKKIQEEMTYPGQIKITVIRETRAVNYAK